MVRVKCTEASCEWQSEDRDVAMMGMVLAAELNNHTTTTHAAGCAPRVDANIKKPGRPVIKEDTSDQDWTNFEFEWGQYCMAVGNN